MYVGRRMGTGPGAVEVCNHLLHGITSLYNLFLKRTKTLCWICIVNVAV